MPLPPSSTGLQAWISLATFHAISAVRKAGHPFVLISGARTSTILQRLPFLPRADAVVTENGGAEELQCRPIGAMRTFVDML